MIAPLERKQQLVDLAKRFLESHLARTDGVNLPPDLRWAIAKCAKEALLESQGCDTLPQDTCLRPNARVFEVLADLNGNNSTSSPKSSGGGGFPACVATKHDKSAVVANTLLNLVRAINNHQHLLNEVWYQDTIEALSTCGLLETIVVTNWAKKDPKQEEEKAQEDDEDLKKDEYRVYAVLSEIVLLVVMTHCIHAAFVLMDDPMPEFPPPNNRLPPRCIPCNGNP
jgi:hypothetical protein